MKKPRSHVADFLAYLALRLLVMLLHFFPVNRNLRTARILGNIMWFVIGKDIPLLRSVLKRKHREQIMANLHTAFGETYDDADREWIGRASCQHLVMFAMECLFTTRLISLSTWRRYVTLNNFQDALRLLLQGHGAILITGHYGSWEVLGYTLACLGFDIVAVQRPLDNPYLNRYLTEIRERKGLTLLYKKGASQNMGDVLARGKALGFIADQDAGRKGLFVDFFGKKASTYKSIALVAREFQLPVIVGCARRIEWDRFRYEIDIEDVIYPNDWAGREDEVLYITQRFNHDLEEMIRKDPRQYLWLHRRWKTRPREERQANNAATP